MLKVSQLWDICQEEFLKECTVNCSQQTDRIQQSKSLDIRHAVTEFEICSAGYQFCLVQYFFSTQNLSSPLEW